MVIELTKEQKKHMKSILWLYAGGRGSGRTTLLAYALIEAVMITQQDVRIVDHYPDARADKNLENIIGRIIEENELPLEVSETSLRLKYKR